MKYLIIFPLLFTTVLAGVDDKVLIRGKIGGAFDENQVKVIDSLGQTYYLPKKHFPLDFAFKQGNEFNLEVPASEMAKIKILKTKKE